VVPERKKVFPKLTVRENLSSMGSALTGRAHAERLAHVLDLFPAIATRLDESAGRLSGGEQQMLAIGRALLRDPKVLIIDEMTLGLHPSIHAVLFEAVRRVVDEGTSLLLVDESMAFSLELADHCYVIRSGEIVDSGPAERFRADHERAMADVF
ncbi:MAG TPA: ATP-binding cassette domain-containing protein, partial [Acidimicrobiales bacterium]|nr:ATP-binding cassette domain-containing protein [Acidimicrobiales bacterium]